MTESEDETLLDAWSPARIWTSTRSSPTWRRPSRGEFYPLIPINPVTGLAIQEVLELVARDSRHRWNIVR